MNRQGVLFTAIIQSTRAVLAYRASCLDDKLDDRVLDYLGAFGNAMSTDRAYWRIS